MAWWDTILNVFTGGVWGVTGQQVENATGTAADAVHTTQAIWTEVSDFRMWRSLGWILLGIVLIILGFVVWNRKAIGSAVGTAASIARV